MSKRPLTIGIDARAAADERAGRGRYVRELLGHLAKRSNEHAYVLYGRKPWTTDELDSRFRWESTSGDVAWHLRAAAHANRACDVFLSTNSYLIAWFLRIPSVVVVHDMVAFDPSVRPQRRSGLIERLTLRRAVRRASAISATSAATRDDLIARCPWVEGKTQIVPLAADEQFAPDWAGDSEVLKRHGVRRPYVLVAGTLEPRKNLPRLVEAFAGLPEDIRDRHRLVLVGAQGWDTGEIESSIERHRPLLDPLGHVPEADLPALYRGAELFCYPSLYEGFGLPVIEAMSCGTAVLTSRVSSLPEVAGEAAFYVDPLDLEDIRRGLEDALRDEGQRASLARAGFDRSKRFSWDEMAVRTLELLEHAAVRRPRPMCRYNVPAP